MANSKTRLEFRDEATEILAEIARTMGITLSAAGNALVFRYGGHMINTWKYQETGEIKSFMPVPIHQDTVQSSHPASPIDLSELMEPMEC